MQVHSFTRRVECDCSQTAKHRTNQINNIWGGNESSKSSGCPTKTDNNVHSETCSAGSMKESSTRHICRKVKGSRWSLNTTCKYTEMSWFSLSEGAQWKSGQSCVCQGTNFKISFWFLGWKKCFILNLLLKTDGLIGVFRATTELYKTSNPELIFKKPDCSTALLVQGASDWLVSVPGR